MSGKGKKSAVESGQDLVGSRQSAVSSGQF